MSLSEEKGWTYNNMTHNSHPQKCKHELEYCEQCNVVFCKKCKEEWKKEMTSFSYTSPATSTWPYPYASETMLLNNHTHA